MSGSTADAEGLLGRLAASPDIYVHSIDLVREIAVVAVFDAGIYRAASFLDQRVLRPGMKGAQVPLSRIVDGARAISGKRPLHFIFHTGHVGSTLVSRLVEEAGGVLALREPLPLRTLAETHDAINLPESIIGRNEFAVLTQSFLSLWSRGYPATQAVVLKATSTAGRLAPLLMERQPAARGIYLNLRAEPYVATLLAGANSVLDLRGHGAERMRRLQSFGFQALPAYHSLSPGEAAAMSWLVESWSQSKALERAGGRLLAVDFDTLLGDIRNSIGRVLSHLGVAHSPQFLDGIAQSPALGRYAKAPEHTYSPQLRAQVLRQSRVEHAGEIRKGLAWLERAASASPAAAAVVGRAGL